MNKSVLITGATSGIGLATAHLFAKNNYNIIITGRRKDRLVAIKSELENLYSIKVQALHFDVRNAEETNSSFQTIDKSIFPTIDILVNNAGLASGLSTIDAGVLADWDVMIDTNVKGLLYVSRAILPIMKSQGFGHVVNISSTAGKGVYPNGNVYCATKHAVDALSQSMRIDMLEHGIKVTSINPGACETEFSLVRFHGDKQKADAIYDGFNPLKPEDVADAIYYCCTLPKHVCINDLTLTCLTQANANYNIKKKVY
jgi:NADP-dependent 3-hydroxy acid dehydrogenase YdfG